MKQSIYLYHHLGLGDHISCHGIVRDYCQKYENVFLFVKDHNYKNVKFMYSDLKNLHFLVGDDSFAVKYIETNKIEKNVIYIGFKLNTYENFELQFYKMANVPIENKYKKFFLKRDLEKEIALFNSLNLKKNNYIFLHDGGFNIRKELLDPNLRIIKPETHDFFDWMYTIENAKQIHVIDSAFICLVDCMRLDDSIELYNHRYVRNYPEYIKLFTIKDWNFIY
jgi:hypothetical protein